MTVQLLYVCNEDMATTRQRLLALDDMGIETHVVYTSRLNEQVKLARRIKRAVQFRAGFFPERNNENSELLKKMNHHKYDVLFVEKGLSIKPSTLIQVRKLQPDIKIISYTLDDVMNKHNSSWYYRKSIPLYDVHFTNKNYNVEELKSLGAKEVVYFRNAYSRHVHRPVAVSEKEAKEYGCDVSFIGTFERERVSLLRFLADNGVNIKVWGWGRSAESSGMVHPNIVMTDRYVYGDEYPKVVCASKINLCFLRRVNRDNETTRSVEIPACGGFMLAERTAEHQSLFEEGKEAEYFTSKEELLKKIDIYLNNDEARMSIARKGRERCIRGGYSYHNQLTELLNKALGYEAIGYRYNAPDPV